MKYVNVTTGIDEATRKQATELVETFERLAQEYLINHQHASGEQIARDIAQLAKVGFELAHCAGKRLAVNQLIEGQK